MQHEDLNQSANRQTDAETCRRLLSGTQNGKRDFVRRWQETMYRIAFRIVGQSTDAEEVRQSVLLKIFQRPEILPDPENIRGWIHRCVVNESLTLLRKRKRQTSVEHFDEIEITSPSEYSDDAKQLQDLLAELPDETRALLTLRFDENLTVREIAEVMDTPRSTVHLKLQAAINSLRKQLNPSNSGDKA